jgi:hypothetical protein
MGQSWWGKLIIEIFTINIPAAVVTKDDLAVDKSVKMFQEYLQVRVTDCCSRNVNV